MTNNEKRYVEVDMGTTVEEIRADGKKGVFVKTFTLPELIIKEHPGLREKLAEWVYDERMECRELYTPSDSYKIKPFSLLTSERKDQYRVQADSILSILGIKKEG